MSDKQSPQAPAGAKASGSKVPPERVVNLVREREERELENHQERRSKFMMVTTFLTISVIANAILGWLAFGYFPQVQFAWTSNVGVVCKMPPLKEPLIAPQEAVDMAKNAALGIYSYDYVNFRTTINMVGDKLFTPDFKDKFIVKFGDSANLKSVRENYYVVTAITNDRKPPQLQRKGIDLSGRYFWEVAVPMNVYYAASRKILSEKVLARVTVVRATPSSRNPSGIAVDNITTEQFIDTP